jgi:hypothetical protein
VQPAVVGELRVEGDRQNVAVPDRHRVPIHLGQNLDARTVLLGPRRPDEDGPQRLLAKTPDAQVVLEARQLAAEGVAAADVVGEPQVVAAADDHPRAAAKDRTARLVERRDRLVQALALHAHRDGGRLATRNDQAIQPHQLVGRPDLGRLGAE